MCQTWQMMYPMEFNSYNQKLGIRTTMLMPSPFHSTKCPHRPLIFHASLSQCQCHFPSTQQKAYRDHLFSTRPQSLVGPNIRSCLKLPVFSPMLNQYGRFQVKHHSSQSLKVLQLLILPSRKLRCFGYYDLEW